MLGSLQNVHYRKEDPVRSLTPDAMLCRAKRCAAATLTFEERGQPHVVWYHPAISGTIAIIGPADIDGKHYTHALLCEIGLGRTRPYQPCRPSWLNGELVSARRPMGVLTDTQYKRVGELVFSMVQEIVDTKVKQWKSAHRFLPITQTYFSRKQRCFLSRVAFKPFIRGIRFSFPLISQFGSDVCHAELFGNHTLQESLKGLARFIDLMLTHHYIRRHSWKGRRPFTKLKWVQMCDAQVEARRLPRRHIERLLEACPGGKRNRFYPYLAFLWNVNGKRTLEWRLASRVLPGCRERTRGIQLSIVRVVKKRGYLVAEIFPSQELITQKLEEDYLRTTAFSKSSIIPGVPF